MSLSSFFVVSNALRLNLFSIRSNKRDSKFALSPLPEFLRAGAESGEEQTCGGSCPIDITAGEDTADVTESKGETSMKKEVKVNGMMCPNCVKHVKRALEGIEGVEAAEVSLENKNAIVTMNAEISDETFKAAIEDAGYEFAGTAAV